MLGECEANIKGAVETKVEEDLVEIGASHLLQLWRTETLRMRLPKFDLFFMPILYLV